MRLNSLQIRNYRSIEELVFEVNPLEDESFTYGLMGVNEAGKTSILKAIALKEYNESGDELIEVSIKDFHKDNPIEVIYYYEPNTDEIVNFLNILASLEQPIESNPEQFRSVIYKLTINRSDPKGRVVAVEIPSFTGTEKSKVEEELRSSILKNVHRSIFWTAEPKYLISQPINLIDFSANPDSVSIPLRNCFLLAGIENIKETIDNALSDSAEREWLEDTLGERMTEHIQGVWSDHPVKITFSISDGLISFHIKDKEAIGKAKTVDQRSDGFRHFVSFLLTVSAQNKNNELSKSILLLDEPETHLYPKAQEFLMNELIEITRNERNNIVFFATHSVFMIDKTDLSRNYRIKKNNDKTEKQQFERGKSSYSSIIYDVFNIPSTDYHNELYGILHARYIENAINTEEESKRNKITFFDFDYLKDVNPKKDWKRSNGNVDRNVSLATYIRNYIHHPEAQINNTPYTEKELETSIKTLLELLSVPMPQPAG